MLKRKCRICNKQFEVPNSYGENRGFYCSQKCYGVSKKGYTPWNKGKHTGLIPRSAFKKGDNSGEKNWNWRGGIKTTSQGYILIYKPNHPFPWGKGRNNCYVLRSRLVMEKHLKRFLKPEEVVHHRNLIRDDDRLANLLLFINQTEHKRFHAHINNPNSH